MMLRNRYLPDDWLLKLGSHGSVRPTHRPLITEWTDEWDGTPCGQLDAESEIPHDP